MLGKKRSWAIALLSVAVIASAILAFLLVAHARKAEVLDIHRRFIAALVAHDMGTAYSLMSSDYRASHTLREFVRDANHFEAPDPSAWHASAGVCGDAEVYQTNAEGWTVGLVYVYTKDEGGWRFTGRGTYLVD